ncbi:hypothetical protein OF83DRAFT_1222745 [Amylostereum chailletii]|nr:hypothetical protein OF83DRAFT_1222745 [Amylostereum chailletii]
MIVDWSSWTLRRSRSRTELAVLSACQTATGDEELTEEAVHLAAGMLMTGYRSAIATMWSIRHRDAPVVAEALYSRLMSKGEDEGGRRVAYALHDAVKRLRDKVGYDVFDRWIPFIHTSGPEHDRQLDFTYMYVRFVFAFMFQLDIQP